MIQKQASDYVVAIYCRLSKDDGLDGDSSSIQNQKETSIKYCNDNNYLVGGIYCDDGYSGTNFNRPDFIRMIDDIKRGKINCVITKDLSRLGRNYIQVGYYQEEFFPSHNVRYIVINDNVDSNNDNNDFVGVFKNVINEYYAKDVSKKIKFTVRAKAKNGECRVAPRPLYGYMYNDKGERVPDPETAPNVKMIFKLYAKLKSSSKVAEVLKEEKVYSPNYYNYLKRGDHSARYSNCTEEEKYNWYGDRIYRMVDNQEYLGHYITQKTLKNSFKSKKITKNKSPYIFENKFEPLVTQEEFDTCQQILNMYACLHTPEEENNYKRLIVCGCCGKRLSFGKRKDRNTSASKYRYYCRNKECESSAYINREDLNEIVKKELSELFNTVLANKDKFIAYANELTSHYDVNYLNSIEGKKRSFLHQKKELEGKLSRAKELYISGDLDVNDYKTFKADTEDKIGDLVTNYNSLCKDSETRNYTNEAYALINILESLKDDELTSTKVIGSLITKIEVTKSPRNKDVSVKIHYPKINDMVGGFIDYVNNEK